MDIKKAILFFVGIGVVYLISRLKNRKYGKLSKNGIAATASVLEVTQNNISYSTSLSYQKSLEFEFILAVYKPDTYTTSNVTIKQHFQSGDQPNAGDKVDVWINSANPGNVIIKDEGFAPNRTINVFGIEIPYRKTTSKIKY
jgi:hypothetical protein